MFGSYAKGTENEDSDIDIAIISSDFNDIIKDGAKLIGLTWKIDTRTDEELVNSVRSKENDKLEYLGAIIYGDTKDIDEITGKYQLCRME